MDVPLCVLIFFFASAGSAVLETSLPPLATSLNSTPTANRPMNILKVEVQSDVISLQPPVQTEVKEVNAEAGTIEFVGAANLHLRRKIWVLRSEGEASFRAMEFVLEENGLKEDARLSLWSSNGGYQPVWNGTQSDWRDKQRIWGQVILVTLVISPVGAEMPSFKLKFNCTATGKKISVYSNEVVREEGPQVVSFPPNNAHNYPPWSDFVAVVAPPHGGGLTLAYLDIPGTPPACDDTVFYIYFLEETPTEEPYKLIPSSAFTRCGSVGDISEQLGNFTVAIIRLFDLGKEHGGFGFRLEVN